MHICLLDVELLDKDGGFTGATYSDTITTNGHIPNRGALPVIIPDLETRSSRSRLSSSRQRLYVPGGGGTSQHGPHDHPKFRAGFRTKPPSHIKQISPVLQLNKPVLHLNKHSFVAVFYLHPCKGVFSFLRGPLCDEIEESPAVIAVVDQLVELGHPAPRLCEDVGHLRSV